ncbi:hypothetical protein KAW55_02315 [bacterium]|nr:hypothetical protein [bacterium]
MPYWLLLMLLLILLGVDIVLGAVFLVRKRQAGARWRRATIFPPKDGYRQRLIQSSALEYIQFRAVVDEKTCPECLKLHGRIFPKRQSPLIPACQNCRCEYVGVLNEVLEETRLEEKSLQEIARKELERRKKL